MATLSWTELGRPETARPHPSVRSRDGSVINRRLWKTDNITGQRPFPIPILTPEYLCVCRMLRTLRAPPRWSTREAFCFPGRDTFPQLVSGVPPLETTDTLAREALRVGTLPWWDSWVARLRLSQARYGPLSCFRRHMGPRAGPLWFAHLRRHGRVSGFRKALAPEESFLLCDGRTHRLN